ncbi:hypothetical protein WS67_19040 [Burkholderia singularis]|uniref:Uncharacterized protein n=1 Tax=Burkholderia singularis TaxID=1503053 RepID=A0A103DZ30_9BURK|nr:hypothetical protein WS67_19040 [Burkholderia singularis]
MVRRGIVHFGGRFFRHSARRRASQMLWRIPRRRGAGLAREASGADCAPPWRPASPGRRH